MCDTFIVLPDATKDGSIIFGKNSDRDPNEPHYVEIIQAQDYPPNSILNCTYVSIPQVSHTNRVLLCRPVWIWGAEMGINEFGVVIGNEAVFSKVPAEKTPGLIGMDYLRLALERSSTAGEAVQVITSLLEKYGQSGNCGFSHPFYYHNSFLIADKKEAWKLETIDRQWAAKKIDTFGTISNGLTIGSDWDLCSQGMQTFALSKNLYKKNLKFNFSSAYSDWLYTRFSNSMQRKNCTHNQIASKIGEFVIRDAFKILRTHNGTGKSFRPDRPSLGSDVCMHAGFGPIRVSQTTGSLVTKYLGGKIEIWITGSSAPCISLFKPCSIEQNQLMDFVPGLTFEDNSYWWRSEKFHRNLISSVRQNIRDYHIERDELENYFLDNFSRMEHLRDQELFWEEVKSKSNQLLFRNSQKFHQQGMKSSNLLYNFAWENNNREAKIIL